MEPDKVVIKLSNSAFTVVVRPQVGGSIASFVDQSGTPIFRTALEPDYDDPRSSACFPLVPFSNRILQGRFSFRGENVRLEPNVPGTDRTAHGFGWRSPWSLVEQEDCRLIIAHEREAGDWPWAYRAEQDIALREDGIELTLRLKNAGDRTMPAGLGWHPFFPLRPGTKLKFGAGSAALPGENFMPVRDPDGAKIATTAGASFEPLSGTRYFSGYGGSTTINMGETAVEIISSAIADEMIYYLGPDRTFFCVEPVTHRVGAFGEVDAHGDGELVDVLAPGESMALSMRIRVKASAP